MSIMFDWSSHSRAPFAGVRRFSKSRGLSKAFPSFPSPTTSFLFWLSPQFRAGKMQFLGLSLLPNPMKTLAMQAIKYYGEKNGTELGSGFSSPSHSTQPTMPNTASNATCYKMIKQKFKRKNGPHYKRGFTLVSKTN